MATDATQRRRAAIPSADARFQFAGFVLDAERLELRKGTQRIELQPKVLQLLRYLLENAERTVTKDELLDALWPDTTVGEGSLTSAVSLVRHALGERQREGQILRTVHGLGYRMGVSVTREMRQEMAENKSDFVTKGAHHIGLTVLDLDESRSFVTDVLAYKEVGSVPEYPAVFLSDGTTMITLWQVTDPSTAVPFDRKNVIGLHHLALAVDGDEELEALHEQLGVAPGVSIEFPPEALNGGPARHMMCEIPSGIRIEFIAA